MEVTVTAPTAGTFNRELHRLDANGNYEYRTPDFDAEYGIPDPKRYVMELCGYSDVFQEANPYRDGEMHDRVVMEFSIVNSKKWQGVRFSMAMNVPKDWTDDRSKLHQLFSALQGRPIVAGDSISFKKSLGKQFEGVVENKVSQKGRDYAAITTFLALDQEDDDDDTVTVATPPRRGNAVHVEADEPPF